MSTKSEMNGKWANESDDSSGQDDTNEESEASVNLLHPFNAIDFNLGQLGPIPAVILLSVNLLHQLLSKTLLPQIQCSDR